MDVVDEVHRNGGVMRRAALPRRAVERAVAAGRLVVPRPGLVASSDLAPALLVAARLGGVVSCGSAASLLGRELLAPVGPVHVTVPRDRAVTRQVGVLIHRRDVPVNGLLTTPDRTAADCARCLPWLDAVVVLDSFLRDGVSRADVLAHLRGRGCGHAREAVRRADGRAESSGETVGRVVLENSGLQVEPQVYIRGVGRVDLLVEGRLVVEVDGFAYHSDRQRFTADRRRDAALVAMGYRVLRFTWVDVVTRPDYVVAMVHAALAASA